MPIKKSFKSKAPRARKRVIPESSEITFKNLDVLKGFTDSSGKILGRSATGFDSKKQRLLKKAVKQARSLGLFA